MDARDFVAQLRASAETVTPAQGLLPAATAEESERILRWLELPAVRLVEVTGAWTSPINGAIRHLHTQSLSVAEVRAEPAPRGG